MQSRLPPPDRSAFSAAQQEFYESIVRARGSVQGPIAAWLHSPELASRAEKLGRFCRWGTVLAPAESELIILSVAAQYGCDAQRRSHEPLARQAGLSDDAIQAIGRRDEPVLNEPRLAVLRRLTLHLLETHRIPQPLFDEAQALLGRQALVEAVGVLSYYAFVAITCNAFELALE